MHQGDRGGESSETTQDRNDDRFYENLNKYVRRPSSDGFADADFADALGNAREHNVHDANPTDKQADASDEPSAEAGIANEGIDLVSPIFLSSESEVFDPFMGGHKDVADLLKCFGKKIGTGNFHLKARKARIARCAARPRSARAETS